ncbi:unnamed protein product [Blepharisma stoltei]|uniref:Transmembrane protein 192 n=1 Tax=Blepharisma stoltei TaxID=1481888 RepID=A0AAU9K688_9CILI|nr:unnamed protein product [Blepharisma stoltei]
MADSEVSRLKNTSIFSASFFEKPRIEYKYYNHALKIEAGLKRMNLILTILGMIFISIQILWACILWARFDYRICQIFKKYFIAKVASGVHFLYRWGSLLKHREASHAMNSAPLFFIIIVFEISVLSFEPSGGNGHCMVYAAFSLSTELFLYFVTIAYISYSKIKTYSVFNNEQLFESYVTVLSKKLLKFFPIPDDMEGEYNYLREEQEITKLRRKISRKKYTN